MEMTTKEQVNRRYNHLVERQTGNHAVRPFREDGYVNLLNKYGTSKDASEQYQYQAEENVPDETLTTYYESNGIFAKVIDAPADEAVKRGFHLKNVKDEKIEKFYTEALDELDWEEVAATAIKWTRLYGGAIAVMLINDGRGLEEPVDWKNIQSIDDIRVYERPLVQPDYNTMYTYSQDDPFRTRGSRLGMPEYYYVTSKYGSFRVHDSRCLVFQNGVLPEGVSNSIYQLWGMPEYMRIKRAVRDADIAHGSVVKLLDRSIQAIYKMHDLAAELATEGGEDRVLKRLQTIDMARGLLNSITIDAEGEDYDFRTFSYSGISEVINTTCNYLSAVTNIPQTILFGRDPSGMNATGEGDMENWYSYVERIQKKMLKKNIRYLLSVLFQAGVYTGEVDEVPPINVEFESLKQMSDEQKANLDGIRTSTEATRATVVQTYINAGVIGADEVRKALAKSDEFDVEKMLDDYTPEELEKNKPQDPMEQMVEGGMPPDAMAEGGMPMDAMAEMESEEPVENSENAPEAAPAATKLPEDKSEEEKAKEQRTEEKPKKEVKKDSADCNAVGVLVVANGKILCGKRHNTRHYGLICGPGGHIDPGETPEEAAIRETEEEFGVIPMNVIEIGEQEYAEDNTRCKQYICTSYKGVPRSNDLEMTDVKFREVSELIQRDDLFEPFKNSLYMLLDVLKINEKNII